MCVCVREVLWQCQSDLCPTQITSLIDEPEIGLKGLVPPSHLLVDWHQGRALLTGISVITPFPSVEMEVVGGGQGLGLLPR